MHFLVLSQYKMYTLHIHFHVYWTAIAAECGTEIAQESLACTLKSFAIASFASEILGSVQESQEARAVAFSLARRQRARTKANTTEKQLVVSFVHSLNRICT